MNGHDEPTDDRLEALLDGLQPGDPLADEVERWLEQDGAVPVDEAALDAASSSLGARFAAERDGAPAGWESWRSPAGLLAAAAVLLLVAAVSWQAGQRSATEIVVADGGAVHSTAADPRFGKTVVAIAQGSQAETQGDTVVLTDGVVSLRRTDPRQVGPHRVELRAMDLAVEPVGTTYSVGVRGELAAIWVREGRVRLMHAEQGHLGEVAAGSWALVTGGGPALELHRVPDGPFDPTEIGLDPSAAQLLADMRWLALPENSKSAILRADAP